MDAPWINVSFRVQLKIRNANGGLLSPDSAIATAQGALRQALDNAEYARFERSLVDIQVVNIAEIKPEMGS